MHTRLALAAMLAGTLACARRTPPAPAPTPATEPAERVGLPPVPHVDGPLAIRVVSPG